MTRAATLAALVAALATGSIGVRFGTRAVGGSDSSCYGLTAQALARGALQPKSELALAAPWPQASLTAAPAGFIPSPVAPAAASPVCAPGFALLAVPLLWAGGPDGFFWLSPLAGAALVWISFLLGRRLGNDASGVAAAVLAASMPIMLYQVVQPMNDVTTAACWLGGIAAIVVPRQPRALLAGLLVGLTLLVRPNLLPAGVVVGLLVLAQHGLTSAVLFAAGVVPSGLAVLFFNAALYGGALQSGYGSAGTLFSAANVPLNLARYGRAVLETQLAWPAIGALAPFVVSVNHRKPVWTLLAAASAVIACYLPYTSFPEWWYLRFLLPALVLLNVLAAVAALALVARLQPRWASAVLVVLACALGAAQVGIASRRLAFDLWALEARFRLTGEVIRDRLPATTTAISVWDSGSIRYHAEREAVLWDSLDPSWLDRAANWLEAQGRAPAIVVERWEEPQFRARFATQALGALDWPPRFDIDGRVRVFVIADRGRYLAGEPVTTESVWAR